MNILFSHFVIYVHICIFPDQLSVVFNMLVFCKRHIPTEVSFSATYFIYQFIVRTQYWLGKLVAWMFLSIGLSLEQDGM